MTDQQKENVRPRIKEYLTAKGMAIDSNGLTRCIDPGHVDNNPSCQIFENGYKCHSCGVSGDIFTAAGILIGSDSFRDQVVEVCQVLGITEELDHLPTSGKMVGHNSGSRKKVENRQVTVCRKSLFVPVSPDKYKTVWNAKTVESLRHFVESNKPGAWGDTIGGTWPYRDADGNYIALDVRFEQIGKDGKIIKKVPTLYYDGKNLRSTFKDPDTRKPVQLPILVYNLPDLIKGYKEGFRILFHEGAKCARLANKAEIPGYVSGAWNGGSKKAKYVDLAPLADAGITKVWYYPDRDLKKDKNDILLPDHKQPGAVAALDFNACCEKHGIYCHIIPPYPQIEGDGADIEQAFDIASPQAVADYFNTAPEMEPPPKPKKADKKRPDIPKQKIPGLNPDAFPFHILGTGDDGLTYFVGRGSRMCAWRLESLTKPKLLKLARQSFWMNTYPGAGAKWETPALDDIIEVATNIDFDQDTTRGRGAYWNDDGEPYYFDGKDFIGTPSSRCVHVRRRKIDLGLLSDPAPVEIRQKMRDVAFKLSFRSNSDAIRLLGHNGISWASGLLKHRPPILLTGDAGNGKSYIAEKIVLPLAMPVWADTNSSTAIGLLNRIGIDTPSVAIEEAEKDTEGKKSKVAEFYSLIRSGTTENAPKGFKATQDGGYRSPDPKAMYILIAVDPTVELSPDENRVFRVFIQNDLLPGETEKDRAIRFQPKGKEVESIFTEKNCRAVRAFTWQNIKFILETAERLQTPIAKASGQGFRRCQADSILLSSFLIIFGCFDEHSLTDQFITDFLTNFYLRAPVEQQDSATDQMIDKLLQHVVKVQEYRTELTVRGICDIINQGYYKKDPAFVGDEEEAIIQDLKPFRNALGNIGLAIVTPRSDERNFLAVMKNNTQLMRSLQWSRGYHLQMGRHELCIKKEDGRTPESRSNNIPGQGTRSCLVFDIFKED